MADTTVTEVVNKEVNNRVEAVASAAAAQIDAANKDAEALARAAQQSEHMARLNALEGNITSWKTETEARLTKQQEEITAAIAASQASILSQLQPPPPPPVPVVTTETVHPENVTGEPKPNSKETDTNQKPQVSGPPQRVRKLL